MQHFDFIRYSTLLFHYIQFIKKCLIAGPYAGGGSGGSKEPPFLKERSTIFNDKLQKILLQTINFHFKTKFDEKIGRERAASESHSWNDFFHSKQVHFWWNRTPPCSEQRTGLYSTYCLTIRAKSTAQGATKLSGVMEYGSVSVLDGLKSTN